ncbi:hypothetical protein B9Z55_003206 [Caenorhabditis nigoni]|nr:hypothetical protein B9Z55_003206 [Caenorhabditis nigoni]
MLQKRSLILLSLLILSSNAFLLVHRKRANDAPANEERHRAETIEKGRKEYRNLMEAIAHLKNPSLLEFLKFDGPSEEEEKIGMENRLCGMKLVEKVASLCQNGCQLGYDISSSACFHGFSDAELIQECCPTTYRNPSIPKNFVF